MLTTKLPSLLLERYDRGGYFFVNLRKSFYSLRLTPPFVARILTQRQVNPVTHAVGNTIKRVVIIVASVVAFKTPMSTGSIIGSSIAIAGTLMYSLAMNATKK